jgi:hypothetical protein
MNKQTHLSTDSITHSWCVRAIGAAIPLALVLLLAHGCKAPQAASDSPPVGGSGSRTSASPSPAPQATFDSAELAVDSLVSAARARDTEQLKKILGPQSEDILSSGDPVADKNTLDTFLKAYDEKHQLVAGKEGSMTVVVGKSDWPMPIPLVQEGGKWRFDTEAGKEEILNRRIGRNELSTIQTCLAILDAQREYVSHDRDANGLCEYATRFISEPGKKNGLYWPTKENEPPSPLGPLAAAAAEEGYKPGQPSNGSPRAYHGYRFHILTRQGASAPGGAMDYMAGGKLIGGFAVVAWPADYGNSGIMTFIMDHDGIVYQRDLGDDTAKTAASITAYDPGPEWKKAEPQK